MQKSRTFDSPIVRGVLMLFLLSATGCQIPAVSDDFEQIELGRPLPAELPVGMERTVLGAGLIGSINPESRSMTNADMQIINALTNETGNVVAKSYLAVKMSHCILFIAGSYTYVIELDVPAEAFKNTTKAWKVPQELLFISQNQMIGIALREKEPFVTASQSKNDDTQAESTVTLADMKRRANIFLLSTKEAIQAMEKPPKCSIFDLEGACKKIGEAFAAASKTMERLKALPKDEPIIYALSNVPEAILYYRILLGGTMCNKPDDEQCPASPLMYMYVKWIQPRVIELLTDHSAFAGATEAGYDRSILTLDGMNLRVRNIGGRRVRVEISGTLIRDPIIAPLMLLN